jgi:hypothetical protein
MDTIVRSEANDQIRERRGGHSQNEQPTLCHASALGRRR